MVSRAVGTSGSKKQGMRPAADVLIDVWTLRLGARQALSGSECSVVNKTTAAAVCQNECQNDSCSGHHGGCNTLVMQEHQVDGHHHMADANYP